MSRDMLIDARIRSIKKFYLLEYFYVLLKSVEGYSKEDTIFDHFVKLKQEYQLGESKFKKLTVADDSSNPRKIRRYKYTFQQVLSESEDFGLINRENNNILLTQTGRDALNTYKDGEDGPIHFNKLIFTLMEKNYHHGFYYLINLLYGANPSKHGLLILPSYSPYQLRFDRMALKTTADFIEYFEALKNRLEADIEAYLGAKKYLDEKNHQLIERLINARLLSNNPSEYFNPKKYNSIVKRGRDYWLNYFLQDIYKFPASLNTFEIWAYRGKQMGVLHITEFYPDAKLQGRIVYPLSILAKSTQSRAFEPLFSYPDGLKLFVHNPSWISIQEEFVKSLHEAYVQLRTSARTYFVNLASVRELVCYNIKIPEYLFDKFLGLAYRMSFSGDLKKLRISLEVDKLPTETTAMYLKRTPVMIDGKYRNIIAVDVGAVKRGKND